jgi:hypothetical protein
MIVPKGKPVILGKRTTIKDLLIEMREWKFTGCVEISYKQDELSKAKLIFKNGDLLLCGIERVISKREIIGNEALEELSTLESCIADIYSLNDKEVSKALEWNKGAIITTTAVGELQEITITPEHRKAILEKYGIREPSPQEVDEIIASVLEDETEHGIPEFAVADLDSLKKELKDIAERHLGKISRKVVKVIDSISSDSDIDQKITELQKAAKSLVMFVPKKKIDEMLEEMNDVFDKYGS